MADICNTVNIIFNAATLMIATMALLHAATRTVPVLIVKFRVAYAVAALIYSTQVFHAAIHGPARSQIVLGLLSPAHQWTMILYFFENYATAWANLLFSRGAASSAAKRLQQYVRCYPHFRVLISMYSIVVAMTFVARPQNWATAACEVAHLVGYLVAVGPGLFLLGRMVRVLAAHRRKSLKLEHEAVVNTQVGQVFVSLRSDALGVLKDPQKVRTAKHVFSGQFCILSSFGGSMHFLRGKNGVYAL